MPFQKIRDVIVCWFGVGANDGIAVNENLFADLLFLVVVLLITRALVFVISRYFIWAFVYFHDLVFVIILWDDISDRRHLVYLLLLILRDHVLDLVHFPHLVLFLLFQILLLGLNLSLFA